MQSAAPANKPDDAERRATLRLRAFSASDAAAIAGLCADPSITRMTSRMPDPYRIEDAEAFLAYLADEATNETAFAIEAEGALAGACGWKPCGELGVAEIGYWLGRPFWGRGLAVEAGRAVLRRAFGEAGMREMRAVVFQDNPASIRVLEKLGFRRTGAGEGASIARGGVAPTWTYALSRGDWEAAR